MLDALVCEHTFATGRIHLMFDKVGWRPEHYVRSETVNANINTLVADIRVMLASSARCWLSEGWKGFYELYKMQTIPEGIVEWIKTCEEHTFLSARDEGVPWNWHLPELCGFGSSLHVAMQIAANLGYNPLYLIGCDLGYGRGYNQPDHFTPNYHEEGDVLRAPDATNRLLLAAHGNAAMNRKVKIINCTPGGELECYYRKDFWKVLDEPD